MDLFINISLNYTSIVSRLVSQSNNKSISNDEQIFHATALLPITFGIIFPLDPRDKILKNFQISSRTMDENKNSEVCTINILLDVGSSA